MKKIISHIITLVAAALTLLACNKKEMYLTDFPITMSLTEAGSTKSLLDAETFEAVGNQIQIYDYYYDGSAQGNGYYFADLIQCAGQGNWPFVEGGHKWTTDGVHKFFGWMVKDVNQDALFTPSFAEDTKVLTIPTTTLSQNGTAQYDFMYSNIHERNLNDNPYFTAVPLEFSHLFSAFKVTAANNSSNKVYLKKVTITGLRNKRSVTISYAGNENPVVNYVYPTDTKASDFVYEVAAAGLELSKNAVNVSSPSDDSYTMMWAHSKEDFAEAKIVVEYNYQEPNGPLNTDGKTTVELKDLKWDAGSKNVLGLMFRDKEITLTCKVEPWNMVEEEIDFTDQITVSKPIKWEENTVEHVDYDTGEVILYSDTQIVGICNFHIDTPSGATWTASLIPVEGYSDAFAIEDGTKYGAVGVDSQIKIRVTNKAPIAPRHVVKLRITVQTADGRTIIADLMPKNDQNEELKEFKLIQNLING